MSDESTPFVRWLRKAWEKAFGKWSEGPQPPKRLSLIVLEFARLHPKATRIEWIRFAAGHGDECYRSGYLRGIEAYHRDPEYPHPDVDAIAEAEGHDWSWIDEGAPSDGPPHVEASDAIPPDVPIEDVALYLELKENAEHEQPGRRGGLGGGRKL